MVDPPEVLVVHPFGMAPVKRKESHLHETPHFTHQATGWSIIYFHVTTFEMLICLNAVPKLQEDAIIRFQVVVQETVCWFSHPLWSCKILIPDQLFTCC